MDDTGGEKGEDDKEDFLVLDINDEDKIGMSVDEEEDDFLVLGVNDEDKIGMSVDEEEVATKEPSNTEKKMTSPKPEKGSKKRKHKKKHKHKKHRNKDEVEVGEPEACPSISPEENYEDKRRRRRERLEAQTEKDRPAEDSDKVILNESTVYSMGNYCSTMLAGLKCNETSCSWSHVMLATDAASQFSKILQFR